MATIVLNTDIPGLAKHSTGKVRDVYDLGKTLLIVTTDRISAYDVIMPNGIPHKGRVLTGLSRFWFLHLRPFVANHYITFDLDFISARMAESGGHLTPALYKQLAGRSMLVLKANVFPVECVVRGYISGSLWKEYLDAGGPDNAVTVHGLEFPSGLRESDRLPEPIFTPATKATTGHDENISEAEMADIVGREDAIALKRASLDIYKLAAERALRNGIIIADTKFEFGIHNGQLTLVDEALTPDSSRFWDAAAWQPGRPQASFDKQFLRDWLTEIGWNREPPAPDLPNSIVQQTASRYREAFRRITGDDLKEI
jgi:phosphoribosylaminoimidazole-succinocarboxamide synthase